MMKKRKETLMEAHSFTCPNPDCGKTFNTPIKAENRSLDDEETYDACPYCLTEITSEESYAPTKETENAETTEIESQPIEVTPKEETLVRPPPKVNGCAHHLGYLSKREKKEGIPEECLTCENIVQCMLKNVTG